MPNITTNYAITYTNCSEVLPRLIKMTYCKPLLTSTEQALRSALAAGREKEGELATNYFSGI